METLGSECGKVEQENHWCVNEGKGADVNETFLFGASYTKYQLLTYVPLLLLSTNIPTRLIFFSTDD